MKTGEGLESREPDTIEQPAPTVWPMIEWPWFIASQIAFGLVAGLVISRAVPVATMQTWPLAARAGVEATGMGRQRERDR